MIFVLYIWPGIDHVVWRIKSVDLSIVAGWSSRIFITPERGDTLQYMPVERFVCLSELVGSYSWIFLNNWLLSALAAKYIVYSKPVED